MSLARLLSRQQARRRRCYENERVGVVWKVMKHKKIVEIVRLP